MKNIISTNNDVIRTEEGSRQEVREHTKSKSPQLVKPSVSIFRRNKKDKSHENDHRLSK